MCDLPHLDAQRSSPDWQMHAVAVSSSSSTAGMRQTVSQFLPATLRGHLDSYYSARENFTTQQPTPLIITAYSGAT